MSVNKAIIVGRATKEPEVSTLESGIKVAKFSVATSERAYTLANGTQVPEKTEFHSIIAWRGLAELAEKYIQKGTQVYVEGKITTRSWEKDGIKRYVTEIVAESVQLLGKRAESEPEPNQAVNNGISTPVRIEMPEHGADYDENGLPF